MKKGHLLKFILGGIIVSIGAISIFLLGTPNEKSIEHISDDVQESSLVESVSEVKEKEVIRDIHILEKPFSDSEESQFPKKLLVMLPSGLEIYIDYKLDESLLIPLPNRETYDTYIHSLIDLSDAGVAGAAANVEALLRQCSRTPRTPEDATDQLDNFLRSGELGSANPELADFKVEIGSDAYNQIYQDLQYQHKLCSKITEKDIERTTEFRELAYERGDFGTLSSEALSALSSDPSRFFEISKRSWELGNLGALSSISYSYQQGLAPSTGGQPDLATAYAYELASFLIQEPILSQAPDQTWAIDELKNTLEVISSNLTPHELETATELSEQLIQENKNCCKSFWP